MEPPSERPEAAGGMDGVGQNAVHVPVLPEEVHVALDLSPGLTVVDGTVGAAGHAAATARSIAPGGLLVGLDQDLEILAIARANLEAARAPKAPDASQVDAPGAAPTAAADFSLHHLRFSQLREGLQAAGRDSCDRVFLDLGVSSLVLDRPERGFAIKADGPLDMRMDQSGGGVTAAEWLRRVSERDLEQVLRDYGDERYARRIARAIVAAARAGRLQRTGQLADAVFHATPPPARGRGSKGRASGGRGGRRIHPATRTFQAIRMRINDELGELEQGLEAALDVLKPGGRLVVISFHSAEDRIVKRFVRERMEPLHRKPVLPTDAEVEANPRARSARLRCGIRRGDAPRGPEGMR